MVTTRQGPGNLEAVLHTPLHEPALHEAAIRKGTTSVSRPARGVILLRAELSAEAKAARKPLPPEELIDAKSERVHRDLGRARAARAVRNTGRGSD